MDCDTGLFEVPKRSKTHCPLQLRSDFVHHLYSKVHGEADILSVLLYTPFVDSLFHAYFALDEADCVAIGWLQGHAC